MQTSTDVAGDVLAWLEKAWNDADGEAFGACYTADATFVTIRGAHFAGRDTIADGHAGILGSIYAGSINRMELISAREIADGVVVSIARSTLDCPAGPLAGVHQAMSTSVITRQDGTWLVATTHNTLVEA
jgi:uncharacterized protein (TIGR02246 family)